MTPEGIGFALSGDVSFRGTEGALVCTESFPVQEASHSMSWFLTGNETLFDENFSHHLRALAACRPDTHG